MLRQSFATRPEGAKYYLMYVDGEAASTAKIESFGDKYNLNFLATHKNFRRRGLMHYMNLWVAEEVKKNFYVQVNTDEPSCVYYTALSGASIVNTEVKYAKES